MPIDIDLKSYFPDSNTVTLCKSSGEADSRFTFKKSPTAIDNLYANHMSQGKPGYPYMWRKEYMRDGAWCNVTYAVLFMGDDGSVTEAGDWYANTGCTPNVMLGYKTPGGINTGLLWSAAGGLSETPTIVEADVWRQNTPGGAYTNSGHKTYSKTGLIEYMAEYTVPYGRDANGVWGAGNGRTYPDVAHLVMYHGTKSPTGSPIRCVGPTAANGAYYQSYKDYNTYAIEIWIAKGVGIIQKNTPFIEDGTFWGMTNCTGDIFQYPGQWMIYIDDQS